MRFWSLFFNEVFLIKKVYLWGLYGNPDNMLNKYPEKLDFKFEISMIDCGDLFTIFLAKNGTVYTYGENIGKYFM